MSDQQTTRKRFLKFLGLSAGASLVSTTAMSAYIEPSEIRKLNPEQQEFMVNYGNWMDEFIEVIRVKKTDPDSVENNKKMVALTERSLEWKPQLTELMKDETFAFIYRTSIERMSKEI